MSARSARSIWSISAPLDTVPAAYKGRLLHAHNPQVTLMRTTADENDRIGRWIGERLNRMDGPVRFFLPELGVSALDAQSARRSTIRTPTPPCSARSSRRCARRRAGSSIRVRRHINDPEFSAAVVAAFRALHGQAGAGGRGGDDAGFERKR